MTLVYACLYLLAINTVEAFAFANDKRRAIARERRIPEADLLLLAFLGGSPGAFWAQKRFRHKTRKQPFVRRLEFIAMIQAGVIAGLGFWWIGGLVGA
jgi:uncharacterized membrane protein YsdA (DUF1294 family)